MKLKGVSEKVFLDRYSLKDKNGGALETTPDKMWRRVAKGIASVEKKEIRNHWEKKFFNAMTDFKFIPGGRILSGAGTGYEVTYYNCFVIPSPKDSRGGILETLKQMVEIMARGGGVGFNLSSLRARGSRVKKVNGFSSGPCNWAELFSVATKDIIQQGGTRRGALMLMLWDWHPDVEEFITVKQDLRRINGANLSVCVSDQFMKAVENDADWPLVFPDTDDLNYDRDWDGDIEKWKSLGKKIIVHKIIKARQLWESIAQSAWRSAEPGVVFMERVNKVSNTWYFERINCVNPCGEQPLPDWGVCNLGALNLSAFVKRGKMDYKKLYSTSKVALRFLDDVIDATSYFYKEIKQSQSDRRRTGLGTMGLADALIKIKIRYGSVESIKAIDKIYRTIRDAAYESSTEISKEKGSFLAFDAKKYPQGEFIKKLPKKIIDGIKKHGIRNAVLLTQAPTGSTSLLAGVSSGIEPVFEFSFMRRDRLGEHKMYHPLYSEWISKQKNTEKQEKPDYFVSASDLNPEDHVRVQAVIQSYTDSSISKTANAPTDHTVEDVKKLYNLAYELGCKGVTYMREGSRPGVLEREMTEKKKEEKKEVIQPEYKVKPRPMVVHGSTYRIKTPVGVAYITINTNGNMEPLELFVNVGKAGSDVYAMAEGLGRMISLALRFSSHLSPNERIKEIVDQLSHIGGARVLGFGKDRIRSLPDAVAKVLSIHYQLNGHSQEVSTTEIKQNGVIAEAPVLETIQETLLTESQATMTMSESANFDFCPECGAASFVYEEGCKKCYSCGYSEC
ncbi:ribonucleoside-diphosphate reductase [Candidatus Roizmanbacteria bacterium RIFCSPHIGHO2_02_FULL_37_13b]|nr:MAG: ribonucleoside-diphosphate reductase [Candidatus Roizmanbacteria bacterium RIFCSPHIGHO2_02_FULL_37_13b]